MNSIPDVFSAPRSNGNSKIAWSVDEIRDLLDYFLGFVDYNGDRVICASQCFGTLYLISGIYSSRLWEDYSYFDNSKCVVSQCDQ